MYVGAMCMCVSCVCVCAYIMYMHVCMYNVHIVCVYNVLAHMCMSVGNHKKSTPKGQNKVR